MLAHNHFRGEAMIGDNLTLSQHLVATVDERDFLLVCVPYQR